MSAKWCRGCRRYRPAEDFWRSRDNLDGLQSWCKECVKARVDRWKDDHPGRMAKHQRRYKLRRYGLTAADQRLMEDAQGGRCGICGSDEDLVVDHCHATGRVRGLLCWSCNVGLGHFTDDPVRLQAAIAWLAKQDDYRRVLPLPF